MWGDVKLKQFRDPVHGYISVPEKLCRLFIDNEIFQRLRGIEQTSMRPLYPGARHDRFIHSLGVYHLAEMAFHHLRKNTDPELFCGLTPDRYKHTFLIAALMHDCGHAPFSHLFEEYFNSNNQARAGLLEQAGTEFEQDYQTRRRLLFRKPADHEEFSALVLMLKFREVQKEISDFDPVLAARMITGCIHMDISSVEKQVENCLIQLLNGPSIDVDKLDYIVRDTWASGVNNTTIDLHRLLTSLEIVKYHNVLTVVFRKSALSVLQGVVNGRNFLYQWIYSHHLVVYHNYLLSEAVKALNRKLSPAATKKPSLLDVMFSIQPFLQPVSYGPYSLYLPSDGDLYFMLKCFQPEIPEFQELLSRQRTRVPLWKTYAEFSLFFGDKTDRQLTHIGAKAAECLSARLGCATESILVLKVAPKYVDFAKNELLIKLSAHEFIEYEKAVDQKVSALEQTPYFYIFIPVQYEAQKKDCLEFLKELPLPR